MTVEKLFSAFKHGDKYRSHKVITSGHINTTYKVNAVSGNSYILQKMNASVFSDIHKLIENKVAVSNYLEVKDTLEVAEYVKTVSNNYAHIDLQNTYWTLCEFIKDSVTFLIPKDADMAYQAGIAIGQFHKSMADFDHSTLHEILPNFHNALFRLEQFESALKNTSNALRDETKGLIEGIQNYKADALKLHSVKNSGEIPIRVTHNDAKLANLLFHKKTLSAIALIDFDTVMQGIINYDFGDAVRSICSTALEDEQDLNKVSFNMDYYKAFISGFASKIRDTLTQTELNYLPLSANYMMYLQGLRFLTDYLNGDVYYKIDYPKHNLIRAKNQFKLLQVLHKNSEDIKAITANTFNF